MKQGLNFKMPVRFSMELDKAKQIEFKLAQGTKVKRYLYPSETAVKRTDHVIDLYWTAEETYEFEHDKEVLLDTRITLNDSTDNPETEIVSFKFNRTLFEVNEHD